MSTGLLPGTAAALYAVCDGHLGSECSTYVSETLPGVVGKHFPEPGMATAERVREGLVAAFDEVESGGTFNSGSCCSSVLLHGRHVYCANVGDCQAALIYRDGGTARLVNLHERHALSHSKAEMKRVRAAGGEILRGSRVVAWYTDEIGRRMGKSLEPTRMFGDHDFKKLTSPREVVCALPTGLGVGYEGARLTLEGAGPFYLLLGSDGLWDVATEEEILSFFGPECWSGEEVGDAGCAKIAKALAGRGYANWQGYADDVTAVVTQVRFPQA